jgi:hypothetical protein
MGYHGRVFCALLFREQHFDGVPDPSLDWNGFKKDMERLLRNEVPQFGSVKKREYMIGST